MEAVKQKNRNRIMELAQKWDMRPNDVLNELLDKSLSFYNYEFSRAGSAWTSEDKKTLIEMYTSYKKILEISRKLQRTKSAILSRLVIMGYLVYDQLTNTYRKTDKR
jgi:hypothetical protein